MVGNRVRVRVKVEVRGSEVILPPVPNPKVCGPGNLYQHSREMSDRQDYYK